ncbi:MAG: tetratricopeptide repeat protein [Nitrospiraceae bacterium]|nr:tetratricopeptide repeat protein [Nitrospiraceae bacterium]
MFEKKNGKTANEWVEEGRVLDKLGRYEEAIRCYDKVLEINPKNSWVWNCKGDALRHLERYEEAMMCCDKAIEIRPKDPSIWCTKRTIEEELRKRREKEAKKCIKSAESVIERTKCLNLAVNNSERLLNEAKSLLAKHDYATAIARANRCKSITESEMDKKFKCLCEGALNAINDAQSTLHQAKKFGINAKVEEEELNNAKLKLDKKDFLNATKLTKECKSNLNEKINEYKKAVERNAKQSLDFAYSKIKEAKKLGINVSSAQDLHKKAIFEFDNREYEKTIEYAEKGKKSAENEISRYNCAKEQIRTLKDSIENVKRIVPIPKVKELIEKAESSLKVGTYNNAFKFAKQAEEEALRLKKDYETKKEVSDFISSTRSEIMEIKSSGVRISKSEELIEQAKSELDKNNFERAKGLSKEAERLVHERKSGYNLAFKSISGAEKILNETKNKGVIISSDLLIKSKQAFDTGDYEGAIKSAGELKNLVNSVETKYKEARENIKSAESSIEKAQEFGCDVSNAFSRLKKANSASDTGNYEESIKHAKQSEETIKKIQEESRPEITLNLPEGTFSPNQWKKIDITIQNTGSMHAREIAIEPSGEIEFRRMPAIPQLNTNETETITIAMKPTVAGDVPIDIVLTCKDALDRDYTSSEEVWVTVADSTPERSPSAKQPAAIEIKRDYEVLSNNDLRFGIRVVNSTDYAIMDVKTILSYPKTLFSLKGSEIQTLSNIDPHGKRTATYKLTPRACIHNEKIDATIFFKDHTGSSQNVPMRPKEVHCVRPYLKEKPMREGEFAQLADASEHIQEGLLFMGVGVGEIAGFVKESCAHRLYVIGEHEVDVTQVVHLAGESLGEKAYYLLTAVIQPYEGITQVALRAYSDKPYGLHGFLSEMAGSIRHLVGSVQSAREIGVIEKKQVINIIDSVVQRTSFSGAGDGGSADVNIEGSVVHRSNVGGGDAER